MVLSEEWHMSIYLAASSALHFFDFINRLRNDPRSSLWTIPERPELAQSDHPEILEALRARDGERASALMRTHILNGKNLVLDTPVLDSASKPVKQGTRPVRLLPAPPTSDLKSTRTNAY